MIFRGMSLLALFLIASLPLHAQESPAKEKTPLRDFILKMRGRQAYGLYLQKRKVGWMVVEIDLGTHEGKEVATRSTEASVVAMRGSERVTLESRDRSLYELEGEGALISAESWQRQDGRETTTRIVREGGGVRITAESAGGKQERWSPRSLSSLSQQQQFSAWLAGRPRPGATFLHRQPLFGGQQTAELASCTYKASRKILLGGVPVEIHTLRVTMQGATFDMDVKADGTPFTGTFAGVLSFRAEEETTAKKLDDVLANRAGDCTEHTLLFVTLARAAGIPAREVGGLLYDANGGRPIFGWHAWAEIHDRAQWISVDPTWNQFFVDATHIKLSSGMEDFSWANLISTLKMKVVRFRTEKRNQAGVHTLPGDTVSGNRTTTGF